MKKLLPVILAILGLLGGGGAGLMLRPAAEEVVINPCGEAPGAGGEAAGHTAAAAEGEEATEAGGEGEMPTKEFVKLNNQFIVPVVEGGAVRALVILSVSLEVKGGTTQEAYNLEPKLRDGFLKVLFDHANSGGFDGTFTNANTMEILHVALFEAARSVLGDTVSDVLITDIVRQDG